MAKSTGLGLIGMADAFAQLHEDRLAQLMAVLRDPNTNSDKLVKVEA